MQFKGVRLLSWLSSVPPSAIVCWLNFSRSQPISRVFLLVLFFFSPSSKSFVSDLYLHGYGVPGLLMDLTSTAKCTLWYLTFDSTRSPPNLVPETPRKGDKQN